MARFTDSIFIYEGYKEMGINWILSKCLILFDLEKIEKGLEGQSKYSFT